MSPRDSAAARGPQQTVILKGINQENSAMTTHMKAVPWPTAGEPGGGQENFTSSGW